MQTYRATYSPEDNKLRLYASERLDEATYRALRAEGFIWAPRQKLFVAPKWSPNREDALLSLVDDIEDEDISLVDRQAERSERFTEHREKRAEEAIETQERAGSLPDVYGHHDARKARKQAEKAEQATKQAIRLWETASYWKSRAAGALRHAKYKELPGVRARRIKGLQAEKRAEGKAIAHAQKYLNLYQDSEADTKQLKDGRFLVRALLESAYNTGLSYEDGRKLKDGAMSLEEAKALAIKHFYGVVCGSTRILNHLENRLAYEIAMLNEQGEGHLIEKQARPKPLPLVNYRCESVTVPALYRRMEPETLRQVEMTQAGYRAIYSDYKGTRIVDNSHRVRTAVTRQEGKGPYTREHVCVFLTDSKTHERPAPITIEPELLTIRIPTGTPYQPSEESKQIQALKEGLSKPKEIIIGDQLFPTPLHLCVKMVGLANVQPGHTVLEPSAGTGNILKALPCVRPNGAVVAVELLQAARKGLEPWADEVHTEDFLSLNGSLGLFDRILMNPPFKNGIDIQHIIHAKAHLKPGGRLVAICANGPRQQERLKPLADYWEDLPEGTFKEAGTNVNTALLVIEN